MRAPETGLIEIEDAHAPDQDLVLEKDGTLAAHVLDRDRDPAQEKDEEDKKQFLCARY